MMRRMEGKTKTGVKEKQEGKMEISLVVPAHNSASVIENSIHAYSKFLSKFCKKYEIVAVCNACTDETAKIVGDIRKKDRHVKLVEIKERGKGIAILKGLGIAKYGIIGFMDADCVFDFNAVKEMLKQLNDYDCVIASKWLGKSIFSIPEPLTRKILAVGWKALTVFLFHIRFHDTQAGCKFLKKTAYKRIDKNFLCKGFDFDVELLYKLEKKGYSIKEVYIPTIQTFKFSTFRLKFIPGMFFRMFKLWTRE